MREKLSIMTDYPHNGIFVTDKNEEGQPIEYTISDGVEDICVIKFQDGGRNVPGSRRGVISEELVRIALDQIGYFCYKFPGDYSDEEMCSSLRYVLNASERRYKKRAEKGTLGNDGSDYFE